MIERRYENDKKVYVKVAALFTLTESYSRLHFGGRITGDSLDRIIDICRAASLKASGTGIRYTCMVQGKETNLFFEEDRWFIERKETSTE